MPFRAELDPVFRTIRDAAVLDNGLTCERADDIYSSGVIIDDVWAGICRAQILVADATGRNANVFYEIGLAHAIGKSVVILAQSPSDIPFDLNHRRTIFYRLDRMAELRIILATTLERMRWSPPEIHQWLETSHKDIRIGLHFPADGTVVHETPIESTGRVIGLDGRSLRHRIQAFVFTDREHPQDSAWIDVDGCWAIRRIHLGTRRHQIVFRVYDETGVTVAASARITVLREEPKPRH
jgi:hypothetical protein